MIIIDGSSILYRSYYGLPEQLQNERGEPTGAIVGFMRELLKDKTESINEKIIVVMDKGGSSKRKEKYAEYKINRRVMPDDLRRQGRVIEELIVALGIDLAYAMDGAEGDDAIGTLAYKSKEAVRIVSVDADMLQLLNENIEVELLKKNSRELYDEARFKDEYGIKPSVFADYKGLRQRQYTWSKRHRTGNSTPINSRIWYT